MIRVHKFIKLFTAAAIVMASVSCGRSNPDIHGGNTNPVRVKVMTMASSMSDRADAYSGTVEPGSSTTLSFPVAGTISKIYVTEGQHVSKGQLIASVDGSSLRNAYNIAEAACMEAQDAYDRMKKLHDAHALPDMQWVAVQEKLKQAKASVAIARTAMNDANIHSPITGVVAHKLANDGQTVAPGLPIVEIVDMSTLKVKITVPESEMTAMAKGIPATISAGNHTYSAKLIEKGVSANALSHNYDVKFLIANPDDNLMLGMICSVAVDNLPPSESKITDIVLPPQAIVLDWDNTHFVWVKKNGEAQRVKVTIGGIDSRGITITGGIEAGDSVILEGQQKLSSGLKVTSVN